MRVDFLSVGFAAPNLLRTTSVQGRLQPDGLI